MAKRVITEDLGKIAEKAFCDLLSTPYNMAFKYPQERVDALKPRFASLAGEFAGYKHTGHQDDLNDFTSADGLQHLSVKTTKKGSKICPQVIGQPSRSTFCPTFGLPLDATNDAIKLHIQTNVVSMMPRYIATTFHCPVLFYCEKTNLCQMITMTTPIDWSSCFLKFSHIEGKKEWNESTTLKASRINDGVFQTIGEFQVHNHRNCIKFRFDLTNLLKVFHESFQVREVPS
jgi:hypothetical protein